MAAPPEARVVLFPIYAFNIEVSRAPWVTKEPMIAEMRLQWWRDALDEIAQGGLVRRHEVVTPLALAVDAEGARALDGLVAARRADIETTPFETSEALQSYLTATAGVLMGVAARALGDRDGRAARGLGAASGLVSYLRAVPELEARGKRPLADGRSEAVSGLAGWGLAQLAEARAGRSAAAVAARPALMPGASAEAALRQVQAQPGRVAAGEMALSEMQMRFSRLWLATTGRF